MIKVELIGDVYGLSGYGEHARNFAHAIKDKIDLSIKPIKTVQTPAPIGPKDARMLAELGAKEQSPDVRIMFCTPNFYQKEPDVKTVGWFNWEVDRVPGHENPTIAPIFNWHAKLNEMDRIWTSSTFSKVNFDRCDITSGTDVVCGPVDTDYWAPGKHVPKEGVLYVTHLPNGDSISKKGKPFTVGYIAEWNKRKNIDAFLAITLTTLPPDAVIVLKTGVESDDKNFVKERVLAIKRSLGMATYPKLLLIEDKLTNDDMRGLINQFDVYFSTSRGEGFDLPMVQAMSMGKLCAGVNWSAHEDYMDSSNSIELGYTLGIVRGPVGNVEVLPPLYTAHQLWAMVDEADASLQLSALYTNWKADHKLSDYDETKKNARDSIIEHCSYEQISTHAVTLLEELVGSSVAHA